MNILFTKLNQPLSAGHRRSQGLSNMDINKTESETLARGLNSGLSSFFETSYTDKATEPILSIFPPSWDMRGVHAFSKGINGKWTKQPLQKLFPEPITITSSVHGLFSHFSHTQINKNEDIYHTILMSHMPDLNKHLFVKRICSFKRKVFGSIDCSEIIKNTQKKKKWIAMFIYLRILQSSRGTNIKKKIFSSVKKKM